MDQLPLDGRLTDLAGFARLGAAGVDLLLSDSTNAEIPGFVTPEREIGPVLDAGRDTPTLDAWIGGQPTPVLLIDTAGYSVRWTVGSARTYWRDCRPAQSRSSLVVSECRLPC